MAAGKKQSHKICREEEKHSLLYLPLLHESILEQKCGFVTISNKMWANLV